MLLGGFAPDLRPAPTVPPNPTLPRESNVNSSPSESRPANRLSREKSPYLLQHAHNPVDWFPWGVEAFDKARRENKPIFLSIGYSTCHWCHVMERESFENEKIAEYLKQYFVSIKVDREERPDVDRLYMAYVQAVTGGGGWPMTVFLTPDLQPFHGGTYYPPAGQYGRPGFLEVLTAIAEAWRDQRDRIVASSGRAMELLKDQSKIDAPGGEFPGAQALDTALSWFARSFDRDLGGFGGAPKFPRPSCLLFLLRYARTHPQSSALDMATSTLRHMARGGIHDHLGGGFHRYSVDARWHVPHFEKMLYDQGQLAVAYAEALQNTRDPLFESTLRGLCDYVLRDLAAPGGAFYSAEDADSLPASAPAGGKKREGAFYVFTKDEISSCLGPASAAFCESFGVERDGNADDPHGELTGTNVLYLAKDPSEVSSKLGIPVAQVERFITEGKAKLLALRSTRPRPHLDDKILVGWNGLMISGLARAAGVLTEKRYLQAAQRAATFLRATMVDPKTGELYRRHRDGDTALRGQCDDYANLIQGLLDLYEVDFDAAWVEFAVALQKKQDALFYHSESGTWYSSPEGDASVLLRMTEDYDGAEPAPTSVAARNGLRLAELVGDAEYRRRAERALHAFSQRLRGAPAAVPQMLVALDLYLSAPKHVVLVAPRHDPGLEAMVAALHSRFLPDVSIVHFDPTVPPAGVAANLPFTAGMTMQGGRATAYVCVNYACQLPVTTPQALLQLLGQP
jgi:hypothetical protein